MALRLERIKIGTKYVMLLDQNEIESNNMTANTDYVIKGAPLFAVFNGQNTIDIKGTDSRGNTYGYKSGASAPSGAGYYVNSQRMFAFESGSYTGTGFVFLIKERNTGKVRPISVEYNNASMALYINGYHGQWAYNDTLSGWGNMIKINTYPTNPNILVRKNGEGSDNQYIFQLGTGSSWYGNEITVDPVEYDPDNPYGDGGTTDTGGGDPSKQNWDDESDEVTTDNLPSIGALNSGMVSLFSPSAIQLRDLADFLFSYNFFDWLQRNLQNVEELVVSLAVVPFKVTTGGASSITFLGYDISQFTHPVYLNRLADQYYEFDMGTISFNGENSKLHATDSVFDYSPFSRLGIYLPFIGYQELDIDEIRGSSLRLRYRIDVLSGSTLALLDVISIGEVRTIYQFSGNCLTQLPMGATDMSSIVGGSISIAVAALSAGASTAISSAGDAAAAGEAAGTGLESSANTMKVSSGEGHLTASTLNSIMGMKPNYKHSGAIGASAGLFGVKQPYVFLTTPREAVPEYYERFCGLPCNITKKLGEFSGYTVVEDIRLNGLAATSREVEEIYSLLKSGVIV